MQILILTAITNLITFLGKSTFTKTIAGAKLLYGNSRDPSIAIRILW